MLHQRGHARSKADYYSQHLFIRMLNHTLDTDDDESVLAAPLTSISELPRSESPTHMELDDDADEGEGEFGKVSGSADDEKTMFGSASASRFSTLHARGHAQTDGAAGAGMASLRRRHGHGHGGARHDVESQPPIAHRFADVQGSSTRAQKNARNRRLVRELKRGDRVNVKIQPLCLFLFRDGTVVTIHPGALGEGERGEKQGCRRALTSGR